MAVYHDFACDPCRIVFEELVPWNTNAMPCRDCGKPSRKVFMVSAIVGAKSKGLYPQFNVQAGRTFESAQEERKFFKTPTKDFPMGREPLSPGEYKRTMDTWHEPEQDYTVGLREKMEESYYKLTHGLEKPQPTVQSTDRPDILVP